MITIKPYINVGMIPSVCEGIEPTNKGFLRKMNIALTDEQFKTYMIIELFKFHTENYAGENDGSHMDSAKRLYDFAVKVKQPISTEKT